MTILRIAFVLLVACSSGGAPPTQEPIGAAPPPSSKPVEHVRHHEETLDELEVRAIRLEERVQEVVDEVVAAQTDAERATAKAKLERLRVEKVALDEKLAVARSKAWHEHRRDGKVRTECVDNPLAKGC